MKYRSIPKPIKKVLSHILDLKVRRKLNTLDEGSLVLRYEKQI